MNQKHISHLIDDYIDGELTAEDRTFVDLHIKDCPSCQKELSELEAVVLDLHALPKSIVPPEQLQTAINQKLLQYGSNHHAARDRGAVKILHSPWLLRIAAGFVVLIGAGIVAWFSLHNNIENEISIAQKMETPSPVHSVPSGAQDLNGVTRNTVLKNGERMKHVESDALASTQQDSALPALAEQQTLPTTTNPSVFAAKVETTPQEKNHPKHMGAGILSGKILDSLTGQPLIGANVVLNGTSLGAATNLDGEFKILHVPEGSYNIKVSLVGYSSQTLANIIVQTDSTRQLDFRIIPQAIAGQEVVVTAQARGQLAAINQQLSSSSMVNKVSKDELRALPDATAAESIGRLPGVALNRSAVESGKVIVHGLSPRYGYVADQEVKRLSESRPPFNTEDYSKVDENEFKDALTNPLSTFSIDVDAASYSNVRRFIQNGQLPPHDAVRIEELINYFKYDYPQPSGRHPFSVNTEVVRCPWNSSNTLLLVGLQGKTIDAEKLPSSNLVFLIDVSGSMDEPNKLPLVKAAFRVLVRQLRPQDRVAIVVYAGNAGLVLPSTPGNEKETILNAIESLEAGGSTAGGEGIKLAYDIARQNFFKGGNNRVILATDGDFNVGVSSEGELLRLIENERRDNIFLSVLGFGTGNYKDAKMEKLADHGNGNFSYIDGIQEARKVLGEQMAGTLYTIAKDVKIQVEFNPAVVKSYRLIGYEDRLLNKEDFKDDKKDAGELGAGHTVTALYELVLTSETPDTHSAESLKYQSTHIKPESFRTDELLTVQLRYKLPADTASVLMTTPVKKEIERIDDASRNIRFASAVAMFGMILRESKYQADASYDLVLKYAKDSRGTDANGYKAEFVKLVESCQLLGGRKGR
jgi:Ca-activated chloride channel family protein